LRSKLITNSKCLEVMESTDVAIEKGLNSQIGKRNAYQLLVNNQRLNNNGVCEITFFAMLTHYRLSKLEKRKKDVTELKQNQLLRMDETSGKLPPILWPS